MGRRNVCVGQQDFRTLLSARACCCCSLLHCQGTDVGRCWRALQVVPWLSCMACSAGIMAGHAVPRIDFAACVSTIAVCLSLLCHLCACIACLSPALTSTDSSAALCAHCEHHCAAGAGAAVCFACFCIPCGGARQHPCYHQKLSISRLQGRRPTGHFGSAVMHVRCAAMHVRCAVMHVRCAAMDDVHIGCTCSVLMVQASDWCTSKRS